MQTYLISSLMIFAVFLAFPVGMHRPAYTGASFGERLMLAIFASDRETNCFPSTHVVFGVLSALLVSQGGAGSRVVQVGVWALAASICAEHGDHWATLLRGRGRGGGRRRSRDSSSR